jgi:hypothetical protein
MQARMWRWWSEANGGVAVIVLSDRRWACGCRWERGLKHRAVFPSWQPGRFSAALEGG